LSGKPAKEQFFGLIVHINKEALYMEKKKQGEWSPYAAGGLAGLVLILSVLWTGKYFGASTSFVRSAGMLEKLFSAEHVDKIEYFMWFVPQFDWQLMFVIGIFIGSLISSLWSGTFKLQAVPDMWQSRFGSGIAKRGAVAFVGGIIAMFGARLAGGCPSGHGLSGSVQLAVSGYIAAICFFVGGIVVARLLYSGGKQQ
jgi:uncharacterized membrane protein YedE/YeeE